MGGRNSGRYTNARRAEINKAVESQPSLFGPEALPYDLSYLKKEKDVEVVKPIRYIQGENSKEKCDYIENEVYTEPTVSLEEYCKIIFEYLRINGEMYSILDFYEDDNNKPFEYTLEEVMASPALGILLEQRIAKGGITGKLKGTLVSTLLANKYAWVTSRTATENKTNITSNGEPIKFDFGE